MSFLAFLLSLFLAFTTPCATEDSDNCYWDANSRGNHSGQSFVAVNGTILYL